MVAEVRDIFAHAHKVPGPYTTLVEIIDANKAVGHHWFDTDAMLFFRSQVEPAVFLGRLFVSSEQFVDSNGTEYPRIWHVRVAGDDGTVSSLCEDEFPTHVAALEYVRDLVRALVEDIA